MKVNPEYLAGLFDGEGYVGVICHRTQGEYYTLRLSLTNNHLLALQLIQSEYGGKINSEVKYKKDPEHNDTYHLLWYGKAAKEMARTLLPFSIIKADQLKIAIEFPIGEQIQKGLKPKKVDKSKQKEIYVVLQKKKTWSRT